MTARYFIAGTGTDIGKTFFTCALTHQLRTAGKNVRALKPVISGFADGSDTHRLLEAQGIAPTPQAINEISPWRFAAPLSPDIAAAREGKTIALSELVSFCSASKADIVLCESAGGIMSPLNAQATMLDWTAALGWPVVLVAGTYLGSISHTLTALAALQEKKLQVRCLVLSESEHPPMPCADTIASLRRHTQVKIISLPRISAQNQPWKHTPDLLECLA